jgi:hypothetical protein
MKKNIENIVRHSEFSEKSIEKYLVKSVSDVGGLCLKFSSQSVTGYPDRVVLLSEGKTIWIELKSKGKKLKKIQELRINAMRELEHKVYVCDSKEKIEEVLHDAL